MNKIYRKVWNATLGQWAVASELADNRRACAAGGVTMRGAGLRTLAVLAMMGSMPAAHGQQAFCTTASGQTVGTAFGTNTVSCGAGAHVNADYAIAIGSQARVNNYAYNAIAIGLQALVDNYSSYAIAIGSQATIDPYSPNAVAIGSGTTIGGYANDSIAIGSGTTIGDRAGDAIAIGSGAMVGEWIDYAIAIGHEAVASHINSIALGAGSSTVRGALTYYTAPFLPAYSQNSIGTVAIGTSTGQRQITGVAAGSTGTDAVNVSQLQAAINSTGWTVSAGSSSAAIGPGGTLAFTADSNLTVTRTGTAPSSTINLAMSATPTLTSVTTGNTQLSANGLTTGTGNPSVTINGIDAGGDRITNVAPGTSGTDAANMNQLNGARTRYYSVNSTGSGNLNNDGATGTNAIAAGMDAQAIGTDAVALGRGAQASSVNSVALGSFAQAGDNAVALGRSTTADGRYAVALGSASHADAGYSIAVGEGAQVTASSSNSIALGSDSTASHANSVALGALSLTTVGAQVDYVAAFLDAPQTSFGEIGIGVSGGGTRKITGVAAGSSLTDAVNVEQLQAVYDQVDEQIDVNRTRYYSVNSIGGGNEDNDGATGADAIAAGMDAQASGTEAVALGRGAQALSDYSLALGSSAQAGNHAVAIGRVAAAGGAHTVAIGTGADAAGDYGIAVGEGASVGSSSYNSIALGSDSNASHANSVALGVLSMTTVGAQSGYDAAFLEAPQTSFGEIGIGVSFGGTRKITGVAAGSSLTDAVNVEQLQAVYDQFDEQIDANRTRYYSVNSIGGGNEDNDGATGADAIAAGMDAQASGTDAVALGRGAQALSDYSLALGSSAQAGNNAVAIGRLAAAGGTYTVAIGTGADVAGDYGIAVGEGATVGSSSYNSIALGSDSSASHADSVALGALSMTTVGAQSGYDAAFLEAPQTSFGEIGIGINGGGTRKITGVAAGSELTDAVNVSQLQAVADIADAGWTLTDAGGNAANIGPGGTVTFEGDANLSVAQAGGDDDGRVEVTLNRDLDLDRVTTGDTVIDTDGLTVGDTAIDATGVAVGADVFLGDTGLVINGGPSVTTAGIDAGSLTITSVAAGVNGTDAVNVDQLNSAITTAQTRYYSVNSTGGGNEDNDGATGTDAIAAGKDASAEGDEAVALGYGAMATGDAGLAFGAGAQALSLNSLAFGAGAVAGHDNSIALGAGSATTVGAQSGYAGAYVGASDSTGELNTGGRQVTGVAAGSADTDAVNVSQLDGGVDHAITESNAYTDTQVADANDAIAGLDSRVTGIEGDVTDLQDDVSQLDGRLTGVEDSIVDLGETASDFDNRLNEIESGADGMFQVGQEGDFVEAAATGTNAAAGGNGAVASGEDSTALGNQSTASGDSSLALGQEASAGHDNSVALGQGSATTVGAQTDYEAAYVGPSTSAGEVNVGNRTVSGVAPGIAGSDAANIAQLNAGVNHAIGEANRYTDQRIEQIQNDVWAGNDELRRDMNAAVASALAVKQAPWVPGKTTYYAGVAGYRGQGAVGVSLRRTAHSGRWSLEGGFTQNRDGSGAYVGVSGVLGD